MDVRKVSTFEELKRFDNSYRPTREIPNKFINDDHARIADMPTHGVKISHLIEGSQRIEDALKLYEMAYFAKADILELGCENGLSTYFMSSANHASGLKKTIYTVDISEEKVIKTLENLARFKWETNVIAKRSGATEYCEEMIQRGKKFDLIFVDHSHTYKDVLGVSKLFHLLCLNEGFVLYHDFYDSRNFDPSDKDYGVFQAVIEGLNPSQFTFLGIFGCIGMFQFNPQ